MLAVSMPDGLDRAVRDQPPGRVGVKAGKVQLRDGGVAALGGAEIARGVRPARAKPVCSSTMAPLGNRAVLRSQLEVGGGRPGSRRFARSPA